MSPAAARSAMFGHGGRRAAYDFLPRHHRAANAAHH